MVRDYRQAAFYTWPDLEPRGEVQLPPERQGEAIAVDDEFSIHVTSEGVRAAGAPGRRADRAGAPGGAGVTRRSRRPPPSPEVDRDGSELPEAPASDRPAWPWFLTGWIGLAVIVALVFALRRPPKQRGHDEPPPGLDRPS